MGTGLTRLFGFRDIVELLLVKRLLDTGIELEQILVPVAYLRDQTTRDLADVTLMSDGTTVYGCTDPEEVMALLQGGPGRVRHRRRPGTAGSRGGARTAPSR